MCANRFPLTGLYTDDNHVLSQRAHRTSAKTARRSLDRSGLLRTRRNAANARAGRARSRNCRHPSRTSSRSRSPKTAGEAALEQALKRLKTTASLMMIVAHPDDEDGALLTYLSRGLGVRATLFTLTRGEGGQNAMSGRHLRRPRRDPHQRIAQGRRILRRKAVVGHRGRLRLLEDAGRSLRRWGHERVLYDAVLPSAGAPQVIVATFVGGVTDGHGQHQVSGEIAQEVFKAAADPKVFPEQLKVEGGLVALAAARGIQHGAFAPVTDKGMFDYATGKWAPAKFQNYVTGEMDHGVPSTDVTMPVGTRDPVLGRSYVQIAREGWGEQKSQNGGANPTLSGPASASYHLWAVAPRRKVRAATGRKAATCFITPVSTSIRASPDLAHLAESPRRSGCRAACSKIDSDSPAA